MHNLKTIFVQISMEIHHIFSNSQAHCDNWKVFEKYIFHDVVQKAIYWNMKTTKCVFCLIKGLEETKLLPVIILAITLDGICTCGTGVDLHRFMELKYMDLWN
jgi:hypothetical protein